MLSREEEKKSKMLKELRISLGIADILLSEITIFLKKKDRMNKNKKHRYYRP